MRLIVAAVVASALSGTSAVAAPVVGQISLGGYAQSVGSAGMGGATGISFANASGLSVTGTSGSISSFGAGSGSFSALGACSSQSSGCGTIKDIASLSTPAAISSFLTLTGTPAFSFDLSGLSMVSRSQDASGGSLSFTADGTINLAGFDQTPGQFFFTAQGNNIVSYSATVIARAAPAIPEPATWAMMLVGFSMVGIVARRRITATKVTFA
ncbi:hypothetical protein GGQ80_001152 [Sphingomonas jinjuensis]|uniref:Ice-binding protein C-terminal domain-containing protein n=1 Tax=Sphingomonas jinjuensis TaxID=535907 RepID=A0A840FBW0_9SPHN|nr:FxDxF family PEP-CTERM protein [Sphingomonas jinjuensis]MBB4153264.1 hypothetical protein [Sphingomonas jinjuensis]